MGVNIGTVTAYLELDTSGFSEGFRNAKGSLELFANSSASASSRVLGLSNTLATVGATLTKSVTVPLLSVGGASLKVASEFGAGMSEVKAISGATGSQFDSLREKAIEMGAKTKFSASDSADAFKYMAMAGWDASQMMDGIVGIMDLAAASGEDLATTSDIVTDALTAFGLQASDSAHFADVLAQASSKSNTNVGLMGETFKYVAPVAGALGYSIEDTAVAIGLMANSGIKGSQAGTALRSTITRLANPVGEAKDAVEELGISITNADGTMKPLSQTMVELREKFAGLTEEQKAQYVAMLAGQEGMSGLLAIVNASDEDFQKLTDEINNANGAAKKMSDIMMDNLSGDLIILKSNLESAAIAIGDKLEPKARKLTQSVTGLVEKFNAMSDAEQTNIVKIGALAAGLPIAATAGGKLLSALVSLGKGVVNFNTEASLMVQAISLYRSGAESAALTTGTWFSSITQLGSGIVSFFTNPLNLGILAVGGLTAALVADVVQMNKYREEGSKMTEEQQLLIDKTNELKTAYEASNKAKEETIQKANDESVVQQSLWEKLQSVVDENGKVLSGKEAYAQFVAGELSETLGMEISIVDGQVQKYDELNSSIQKVIETKKAEAVLEGVKEQYTEAMKKQAEATLTYNNALSQLTGTQSELKQAEKEAQKAVDDYTNSLMLGTGKANPYYNTMLEAQGKVEGLKEKLKEQTQAVDDSRGAMEGYNQTIENYEGLSSAIIEGDTEKINLALLKVQNGFKTANTATKESLEEQAKTIDMQYKQAQKALEDGAEGITQETVDSLKVLADQANNELETKLGQDKEVMKQKFSELGIEAPQELIDSLMEKDPEVLQTTKDVLTNMKNGAKLSGEEIKTLFTTLGIEVPGNLITQLKNKEPSVQQQAIQLLMQLQNGEASQRGAVLQQMRDLGIKVDDSVAGGISSNTGVVVSESGNVGSAGHEEMQNKMSVILESPGVSNNTTLRAEEEARFAVASMQAIFGGARLVASAVSVITGVIPGHANGLDYVPYNGYIAQLHEGERVLTKEQNREYNYNNGNTGSGGDVFYFYNTQPNPYEYARQMKRAKKELLEGM